MTRDTKITCWNTEQDHIDRLYRESKHSENTIQGLKREIADLKEQVSELSGYVKGGLE